MNELVKKYLDFLDEEFQYLTKIKLFLLGIPELIANGERKGVSQEIGRQWASDKKINYLKPKNC